MQNPIVNSLSNQLIELTKGFLNIKSDESNQKTITHRTNIFRLNGYQIFSLKSFKDLFDFKSKTENIDKGFEKVIQVQEKLLEDYPEMRYTTFTHRIVQFVKVKKSVCRNNKKFIVAFLSGLTDDNQYSQRSFGIIYNLFSTLDKFDIPIKKIIKLIRNLFIDATGKVGVEYTIDVKNSATQLAKNIVLRSSIRCSLVEGTYKDLISQDMLNRLNNYSKKELH
jgi:hypothetical protein